ncbi:hypothetical protein F5Y06DRAFT_274836 [Hypoxylon sp. FL0890]|nr:hypothetical protein F5Y06DRAFT_274836 [Hypoxylon sp. FL0890]
MGNQLSTEVKAESDGIEGNIKSSSPHSSYPRSHTEHFLPSSPPNPPDIVYSSQVARTTTRPPPFISRFERPVDPVSPERYLQLHRDIVSSGTNGDISNSSPLTPTFMASPMQKFKQEIPESPDYNQQMSTPIRRSAKAKKRRSRNRSSLNSQAHTNNVNNFHNGDAGASETPTANVGLTQGQRQKQESPEASPDMGNTQFVGDLAEADRAQQDPLPSWRSVNGTTSESTSHALSSRKRKTAESGGRRRSKKQKNIHNGDNEVENTTSFSGLAASLYAGRKNAGVSESSVNGSTNSVQEKSTTEFDEPTTHHSSTTSSNMNDIHADSEQVADASADSDDEMDLNPSEDDESDKVQLDNQDRVVSDGDQSEVSKHSEESDDGEQNESVGSGNAVLSSDDASNDEDHSEEDKDVAHSPEHDHNSIPGFRPKQNSARKRVVKPTFFNRTAEGNANGTKDHTSSSSPVAGPSRVAAKKQAKISTMLKGHAEDSPEPKASSSKQRATPKTKNPQPHQLVKGQFSEFELRNITQAVERWRDDHGLTQVQVNDLIQGNPKEVRSHEFWSRIVATCPNRGRQKVINQCRRKFHNFVARGTWTPEQQEELKQMWETHGNKFSRIGKLINRHPEDVRDRIRNYVVCGENRRVDPWTQEEEDKLQSIITEALEVIRHQRQKTGRKTQEPEEDLIDWQRVSELMDRTRSRLQCIQKWKLIHRQQANCSSIDGGEVLPVDQIIKNARDEAGSLSSRDRYSVVKAIRACEVNADSRIPWAKVRSKHLGDRWSRPTLMVVWYRLKQSIPDCNIMSIPEVIQQLSKKYHETRQLEFPSNDDYDMNAEYTEIERKINMILNVHHRGSKTSTTVVKTGDEEEEEESTEDKDEDEESGEDGGDSEDDEDGAEDNEEDEESDKDNGSDEEGEVESSEEDDDDIKVDSEENDKAKQDDPYPEETKDEIEDDQVSSSQSESEDSSVEEGTDNESGGSVDLGHDADKESIRRESSADAPSISDFKSKKTPRSAKRYTSSARTARFRNMTPSKYRSSRTVIDESSDGEQAPVVEEDLSSDTNASEVESIPARL